MRRLNPIKENKNYYIKDDIRNGVKAYRGENVVFFKSYDIFEDITVTQYSNGVLLEYFDFEKQGPNTERNSYHYIEFYDNNGVNIIKLCFDYNEGELVKNIDIYKDIIRVEYTKNGEENYVQANIYLENEFCM